MAYSTIDKATSFQNNILYTGTGSSNVLTGVGFQPDLTWTATRNETEIHPLNDSVNGISSYLRSNATDSLETGQTQTITAQSSDGYTVGTEDRFNQSGNTFVSWNWKAGTTSGLTGGTITPTSYSINATARQGIYKWAGTGSNGTIAHGLGGTPKVMMVKQLNSTAGWQVYHWMLGATKVIYLNSTATPDTSSTVWNDTEPNATTFALGTNTGTNDSGSDYIGYVFCDVPGYFTSGLYFGNYDTNGPMIYTGFRPSLVMVKCSNDTGNWLVFDNKRLGYNTDNRYLEANDTDAEATSYTINIYSNGFKCTETSAGSDLNGNSDSYCWMAWGQTMVSSGNILATAR
jgi:hypothetical protein